jgi:hypothetical protein
MRKMAARPPKLSKRLHPRVAKWFHKAFGDFTQAQLLCVPAILDRQSESGRIKKEWTLRSTPSHPSSWASP